MAINDGRCFFDYLHGCFSPSATFILRLLPMNPAFFLNARLDDRVPTEWRLECLENLRTLVHSPGARHGQPGTATGNAPWLN
jgi:hypothetical protein